MTGFRGYHSLNQRLCKSNPESSLSFHFASLRHCQLAPAMQRGRSKDVSRISELPTELPTIHRHKPSKADPEEVKGPLGLTVLNSPVGDSIADLIFVHGLGGGSRRTWTANAEPSSFWPQTWLPLDHNFRDVTIYTFGYDSDLSRSSNLSIDDHAKSLLACILHRPDRPPDTDLQSLVCVAVLGFLIHQVRAC